MSNLLSRRPEIYGTRTSDTDRNRSGLSSVTILLTESWWQRMIATRVWSKENDVSSLPRAAVARAVLTSNTLICASPAAVALNDNMVMGERRFYYSITWIAYIRDEYGNIFALKMFAWCQVLITAEHTNGYSCSSWLESMFHSLTVVSSPLLMSRFPSWAQLRAFTQLHHQVRALTNETFLRRQLTLYVPLKQLFYQEYESALGKGSIFGVALCLTKLGVFEADSEYWAGVSAFDCETQSSFRRWKGSGWGSCKSAGKI